MQKRLPKILIYFFLVMFIIQMASLLALMLLPQPAQAADPVQFQPQVSIPGSGFQSKKDGGTGYDVGGSTNAIGKYIQAIYNYSIGIVGILATVVLMFGGVLWIVAGGNAERVGNAKAWIGAALSGLVLALCSYVILNTVNPDLVNFRIRTIDKTDTNSDKSKDNTIYCCICNNSCNPISQQMIDDAKTNDAILCDPIKDGCKLIQGNCNNQICNHGAGGSF